MHLSIAKSTRCFKFRLLPPAIFATQIQKTTTNEIYIYIYISCLFMSKTKIKLRKTTNSVDVSCTAYFFREDMVS